MYFVFAVYTESGIDNQGQLKTARKSVGHARSGRQVFPKRFNC